MTKKLTKLFTLLCLCLTAAVFALSFTACELLGSNSGDEHNSAVTPTDKGSANIPTKIAEKPTADEYFEFTLLNDNTYSIKAKDKENIPEKVVIPSSHDGKKVTKIGSAAFRYCTSLESITIPNGVTSVGIDAFDGCDNLQYNEYENGLYLGNENNSYLWLIKAKATDIMSCTLNEKTKFIYHNAFKNCISLATITIPDSVTSIGYDAFYTCSSLNNIHYNGTPSQWAQIDGLKNIIGSNRKIYIKNAPLISLTSVVLENITEIKDYAFYKCNSLTNVIIPNTVTSIGDWAFGYCDSITSITIPDTVTRIGSNAFSMCKSLASITIGDGVTSIGYEAFALCTSLANITIPNNVTFIGIGAFGKCNALTSVIFKNTSGWKISNRSKGEIDTPISVTNYSNNATYLNSTYYDYDWERT